MMKNIVFYIFGLFTLVVFLYSLPTLSFTAFGRNYTLFKWDINSLIHNSSPLGNLYLGQGLNNRNVYVIEYQNLEENEFDNLFEIIKARLYYAELYDVTIEGLYSKNSSKIILNFPSYLSNNKLAVEWLTKLGKFNFLTLDSENNINFSGLDANDIDGTLNMKFDQTYGEHLEFSFKQKAFDNFNLIISQGNVNNVFLNIDDNPEFVLIPVTQQTSTGVQIVNKFKLVPIKELESNEEYKILTITKSLFNTKELSVSQTSIQEFNNLSPEFKAQRFRYFIAAGVLIVCLAYLLNYRKKQNKKYFAIALSSVFVMCLNLFVMKLVAATVSFAGYIVFVLTACYIILALMLLFDEEFSQNSKKLLLGLSIGNVILIYVYFTKIIVIDYSGDAISILATLFLSLASFLYFFVNSVKTYIYD